MTNRFHTFSVALCSLLLVGYAVSQSRSMGLSAAFIPAALDAARTVDSDESIAPASTAEASAAVEAAGAQSHTQGDLQALKLLRNFLDDKLENNTLRAQAVAKAVNAWRNAHLELASTAAAEQELALIRQQALDSPGVREMTRREDDCTSDLGRMLRSASFRVPQLCANVRLSRDPHAMQQYFPN